MAEQISRRAIFSMAARRRETVVRPRPPWTEDARLANTCDGCGKCIPACRPGLIALNGDRRPILDFSIGGCIFCGDCINACPVSALGPVAERADQRAFPHTLSVTSECISLQGISCRLCEDACEPEAIRFVLLTGGRALPEVAAERCNGCGECLAMCPAGAFEMHPAIFTFDAPATEARP